MSGRPFQVGDRVRVTDELAARRAKVFTGTVREIGPAASPNNEEFQMMIITCDEPWITQDGRENYTRSAYLNAERTAGELLDVVELLEAAATDDVDDRAKLAAELELLSGEHRALLGPVDRTGATDKAELDRFMARSKNLDTRVEQLRTAHFPEAATLGWQAGTWFTCDQHGENHRTVWTEQDGLTLAGDPEEPWEDPDSYVDDEETSPSFTCPRCGATSHNPNDAAEGYCGRCHAWTGSRFAPPADAEPALGGQIPDVESWDLPCLESKNTLHAWDEDGMCLLCGDDKPRPPVRSRFSQAGLMSLVGAR